MDCKVNLFLEYIQIELKFIQKSCVFEKKVVILHAFSELWAEKSKIY